jgi:DNA invertase Pin-like site-specific DNA recombinase
MLNVLGSVAHFEREIMLKRQRVGIAKAKVEGRYRGRKPTAPAEADEVKAMLASGLGPSRLPAGLGLGGARLTALWQSNRNNARVTTLQLFAWK